MRVFVVGELSIQDQDTQASRHQEESIVGKRECSPKIDRTIALPKHKRTMTSISTNARMMSLFIWWNTGGIPVG